MVTSLSYRLHRYIHKGRGLFESPTWRWEGPEAMGGSSRRRKAVAIGLVLGGIWGWVVERGHGAAEMMVEMAGGKAEDVGTRGERGRRRGGGTVEEI